MASRFYLSSSTVAHRSPGFSAWTQTTEGIRRRMSPVKDGSIIATTTIWDGVSPGANETALAAQFVSDPMVAGIAFVTTDTIKCQVLCQESAVNDNINRQPITVKVYSEDGATLRATMLALAHIGPNTTEWPTTALNKTVSDGDVLKTGYTTVAGDRLVIEVGGQVAGGPGGVSTTGTLRFGTSGSSDLGENETDTDTTLLPWFEISRTVTFLDLDHTLKTESAEPKLRPVSTPIAKGLSVAAGLLLTTLAPVAATPRAPTYAQLNPPAQVRQVPAPSNLLLTTLGAAVDDLPFNQKDWLNLDLPAPPPQPEIAPNLFDTLLALSEATPRAPTYAQLSPPAQIRQVEAQPNLLLTLLGGEAQAPFVQRDWPLPFPIWSPPQTDILPNLPLVPGLVPELIPYLKTDWAVPQLPVTQQTADLPNLFSTLLASSEAPFIQTDWPIPSVIQPAIQSGNLPNLHTALDILPPFVLVDQGRLSSVLASQQTDQIVNLLGTTLAPVAAPFVPIDWPIPRPPKLLQTDIPPNLQTLVFAPVPAPPFVQHVWPLLPPVQQGFQEFSVLRIGPYPFRQTEWQNPLKPLASIPQTQVPNLLTGILVAAPGVPFHQNEWPGLPAIAKDIKVDTGLNLLDGFLAIPFRQNDWLFNARSLQAHQVDAAQNLTIQLPTGQAPFTQTDWPNLPTEPPKPAQIVPTPNLLTTTLAEASAPQPFSQQDWPVPLLVRGLFVLDPLNVTILLPPSAAPFVTLDWQILKPKSKAEQFDPLNRTILLPPGPVPFFQTDWPSPLFVDKRALNIFMLSPNMVLLTTTPPPVGGEPPAHVMQYRDTRRR